MPVPWQNNLLLTTCVDEKVGQLQKFSQLAAYADFFFPERIEECGERSRLPEREKVLPPYAFLLMEQPKLYDFARYNECLMKQLIRLHRRLGEQAANRCGRGCRRRARS